jgi:hypothetical protein
LIFQVREHLVECQRDDASNVLTNDPTGPEFVDNAAHFRPEVTVVSLRELGAGNGKRLAREAASEEVDGAGVAEVSGVSLSCKFLDVSIDGSVRLVLLQHVLTKRINFAKDVLNVRPDPISR